MQLAVRANAAGISIHALLAESDIKPVRDKRTLDQFLSTLSLRRATTRPAKCTIWECLFLSTLSLRRATFFRSSGRRGLLFLSTLSLRRATIGVPSRLRMRSNFYPRSPCGERLPKQAAPRIGQAISIHALLAESDTPANAPYYTPQRFLSTLSLRRATQATHAMVATPILFLSTLSLRRATFSASIA